MAFVVLHPDHVLKWRGRHLEFEKDLKAHAKERLPGFACPEWVEIVVELPVSLSITSNGLVMLKKYIENIHRQNTQDRIAKDYCQTLAHINLLGISFNVPILYEFSGFWIA